MRTIDISFDFNNLGRVEFSVDVMTSDLRSFKNVYFKLDSGSDFTTVDCKDLYNLGYTREFLQSCPHHHTGVSTAAGDIRLQYIKNISLKFGRREIQHCRIFFALDTPLRSLFGSDILKYFNWGVNYDIKMFQLHKSERLPLLSEGEEPLQIYNIEGDKS